MELTEIEDKRRKDFRRANGAPMFVDAEGKNRRASRPSGWGKELDDENALVNWKINRAVEGVAKNPDLAARAIALKEDDREGWGELREQAINAGRGQQAADIGTAIHAMSERWEDPDDDFDPGDPYTAHLEAYSKELDRLGLVSDLFEYQVVNTEYMAAGTADRLYRLTRQLIVPTGEILPAGTLVVGDLKTGKKLTYSKPAYAVQLFIYASGERYDVETDQFIETPPINQDWAILIHQPSDEPICEALWVDLRVGKLGAELVRGVRNWRKDWRSGTHDMPGIPDPHVDVEAVAAELGGEIISKDEGDAEWVELMHPWVQERLNSMKDHDQAVLYLRTRWPDGVPTPKQGITEVAHMTQVLDLLDKTEAEYGLSFVPGRPDNPKGVHRDSVNHTNEPMRRVRRTPRRQGVWTPQRDGQRKA